MRRKKDYNGFTIYVDEDGNVEGSGFFDTVVDIGKKVFEKVSGETAKKILTKGAEKAFEKGSEKIGTKVGEIAADKIDRVVRGKKENKGEEITTILRKDNVDPLSSRFDSLLM